MLSAIHVLRYLLNSPAQGILLSNSPNFSITAYSDSDWATCANTRKSVTGFYITLGGSPISWKSKKQPIISLSLAEAAYRALRMLVTELSWLKRLLGDLGLLISSPMPVYCDSQVALHITKNLVFHEWTKHIVVDCRFVRDCLAVGLISLHFLRSVDQLVDLMTKSLLGVLHHHHILSKLSVLSPSSLKGGINTAIRRSNSPGPISDDPN